MKSQSAKLLMYLILSIAMLVVLGARFARVFNPSPGYVDYYYDRMELPDSISIASKYAFSDTCNQDLKNRVDLIYFLSRKRMGIGGYYTYEAKRYFNEVAFLGIKFRDGMVFYKKKPINGKPLPDRVLECHFKFNIPLSYTVTDTIVDGKYHKLLQLPGGTVVPGSIIY